MKKIIIVLVCLMAVMLVSCTRKQPEKKPQPTKKPAQETQTDTTDTSASDDVQKSDDAAQSDDVTASDDTEITANLYGSWESDKQIISFLSTGECVFIKDSENIAGRYVLEDDNLSISGTGKHYTVESISKNRLVLADDDGESITYKKLSHTKRQTELTEEELTGTWICRITGDGAYLQFEFELHSDGTVKYTTDDNGKKQEFDNAAWSIKDGRLILDNGSGKSTAKLKYSILRADEKSLIVLMEKCAVIVVREG